MAALYLEYWNYTADKPEAVMVDKIVRFSKTEDEEEGVDLTVIHLTTGEEVLTKSSIKTLTARLERGGEST